jgi:hypothetical protein
MRLFAELSFASAVSAFTQGVREFAGFFSYSLDRYFGSFDQMRDSLLNATTADCCISRVFLLAGLSCFSSFKNID